MAGSTFTGELIHFAAIRMRIIGEGNVQQFIRSLDDVNIYQMVDLSLAFKSNIEPTTLSNYIDQRGQFEFRTVEIDEIINLSSIRIYIRPIATGYPN